MNRPENILLINLKLIGDVEFGLFAFRAIAWSNP
jgi:hypothetical protein